MDTLCYATDPRLELRTDRGPREKLLERGAASLSDAELLAILIGWGTKDMRLERIAKEVLRIYDRKNAAITAEDLLEVRGVGDAKAALLAAALEFSRRRLCPDRTRVSFPADILPLVRHYADRKQEHFIAISLNGAHEVLAIRVVSVGLVNRTVVHPREVFADPIADRATSIVCAHNHPSGNVQPSPEDREVTRRLSEAGSLLGITLLDHIVFGARGYFSFLEAGEL